MKSNFSTPGFLWPLLSLICISVILYGLHKTLDKTGWTKKRRQTILFGSAALIVIWVTLITVLSYKGFFADFSKLPPRPVLAILIPIPFVLLFAFSKTGTTILEKVPAHWLVLMQTFRIFVEVLILLAFLGNKLPIQMTFEGRNFDILSGILSLPAGYLIAKNKTFASKVIIVFNIIGILLLLNILLIAVLSMPSPIRYFINEPSNTLVAEFPFIFLPSILVPIAYSFHIFSLRQLFIKNKFP